MNERLATICVAHTASLRDGMEAISRGSVEIALVVDDNGVLLGTLTDGDVRRALLDGASLDDAVAQFAHTACVTVAADAHRAEVLELMRSRYISAVPVVDHTRRVRGLHVMRELLGAAPRPNAAVILAGGRGQRLRPFTEAMPKPMIPVAGRPIIERLVLHLVAGGVRRVFIAVNYLSDVIEQHFGDGRQFGCQIDYLREDDANPLGTAGALALLPADARDVPVLVMNGDLVTQFSVAGILETHGESGRHPVITVGVREYREELPYGLVRVDEGGGLCGIEEKPEMSYTVNAGVYVVDPRAFADLAPGTPVAMTELIGSRLAVGDAVVVHHLEGDWLDVGQPEHLRLARGESR